MEDSVVGGSCQLIESLVPGPIVPGPGPRSSSLGPPRLSKCATLLRNLEEDAVMRRREFVAALAAPLVVSKLGAQATVQPPTLKGRFKQGVTRGVFARGDEPGGLLPRGGAAGHQGFDLIGPADWPIAEEVRPGAVDVSARAGRHDPRGAQPQGESRPARAADARRHRRGGGQRRAQHHHVLRQSQRHGRRGRRRQLRRVPQRGQGARRRQAASRSAWST